ncbi:hypothetical protein NM208_g10065 [Fusarium decemcellulare]|uniref:Uncharacterized protein n=1 Tax=Fusarium decemcellulare TaxID=57161 RepID=A0ACC1RZC2_9HYPO|nr:hypothetical protein NM208_g10065 [Fusarium decemcellulare]
MEGRDTWKGADFKPTPLNMPAPSPAFFEPTPPKKQLPPTISFRFGSRTITATGTASDHAHPNVLRLRVQKTLLERTIQSVLSYFPIGLVSWAQNRFPEWLLPDRIVLKIKKDGWDEEFNRERAAYEQLRALQGITIPRHYGTIEYNGTRAFILSDIGGNCLATSEGAVLDSKDVEPLLHEALTSLNSLGVSHDDTKLDNFHLVTQDGKDKIMIVDLEIVDTELSAEDFAFASESKSEWLTEQYRGHLESLEYDGLLLPKRPVKK